MMDSNNDGQISYDELLKSILGQEKKKKEKTTISEEEQLKNATEKEEDDDASLNQKQEAGERCFSVKLLFIYLLKAFCFLCFCFSFQKQKQNISLSALKKANHSR